MRRPWDKVATPQSVATHSLGSPVLEDKRINSNKTSMEMLARPHSSPGSAPCDFYLLLEIREKVVSRRRGASGCIRKGRRNEP
ncbi:hypothetical protein EVAR_33849_1 [Eumeta japonica]|uniref:Uncharacterized protein n=1 Tax=Eumeta variegata TaxID=151549 RepID=A0A4C1VAE6_EUMVA|nr:hypothetical protein EVAR_33849_1 [Eumeta japonica]